MMRIEKLMVRIRNILRGVDNQKLTIEEAEKAIRSLIEENTVMVNRAPIVQHTVR